MWLDPANARVLDTASSNAGLVRFLHVLHGSLQLPGMGRQIVGWVGAFMLTSCLTGLWLWWPVTGSIRRGFRWKRQNSTNANLHHQMGFWVLVPLAMLSFTGVWISFPGAFGRFEATQPKAGSTPDRARALRARPLAEARLTIDEAVTAAQPHATGPLASLTWPTDQAPVWKVAFARAGGPAEVEVADATGEMKPPRPPRPETRARLMRRLHDGTGMGFVWQAVFVGGLIPAALAVTGIVMWLRSRGWRAKLKRRRRSGAVRCRSRRNDGAGLLRHRGRFPPLARGPSHDTARAPRRLLEKGDRQALDRLAAGPRPGALLRLDRRHPQIARRGELHHPLHAAPTRQHLEQGQCRPLRGADGCRADDAGRRARTKKNKHKSGVYS